MSNQICKVCAETYPASAPACPRCGFSSAGTTTAPVGTPVDPQGFVVSPEAPSSVPGQVVFSTAPGTAVRRSAGPVIAVIAALAVATIGAGIFVTLKVVDTVGEVTEDITDSVNDSINKTAPGFQGLGQGKKLSPRECTELVTRYSERIIKKLTDAKATSAYFQEAVLKLDSPSMQLLIEVISSPAVAGPASQGDRKAATKAARPLIEKGCR